MQKVFKVTDNLKIKNKFNLEVFHNIKDKNLIIAQIYKTKDNATYRVTTDKKSFNLDGVVWFNKDSLNACFEHIRLKNQPLFNFGKLEIQFIK